MDEGKPLACPPSAQSSWGTRWRCSFAPMRSG